MARAVGVEPTLMLETSKAAWPYQLDDAPIMPGEPQSPGVDQ